MNIVHPARSGGLSIANCEHALFEIFDDEVDLDPVRSAKSKISNYFHANS